MKEGKRSPKTSRWGNYASNLDFNGLHGPAKTHPVSAWMLAGCGIWLIAPDLCFAILRPSLLPEGPRFMATTRLQVRAAYVAKP